MNAVVQPAIRDLVLAPGDALILADPDIGHRVERGEIELAASLVDNGQPASRRLFVFKPRAEDLIIPGLCSTETVRITALATEAASLIPLSTAYLPQSALSPHRGPAVAARIERWLAGLGDILAPLFGAVPSDAVTVEPGARFETKSGATFIGRGATGRIAAKDAALAYPDGEAFALIDGAREARLSPGMWLRAGAAATAFAARFYLAVAMYLSVRMRGTMQRFGRGTANAEEELNMDLLDTVHIAGARFDRMIKVLLGA